MTSGGGGEGAFALTPRRTAQRDETGGLGVVRRGAQTRFEVCGRASWGFPSRVAIIEAGDTLEFVVIVCVG